MNTWSHSQTDAHGTRAPPRESGEKINYRNVGGRSAGEGEREKWMFFSDTSASVRNRMCNYCKVSVRSTEKGWSCHSGCDEEMCWLCVCVRACVYEHVCLYVSAVSCLHIKGLMISGKYNFAFRD